MHKHDCTCERSVHMVLGQHKAHQQTVQRDSFLVGPGVAYGIGVPVDVQPGHAVYPVVNRIIQLVGARGHDG